MPPKDNIRLNAPGEEPTPTRIANFQDQLEQCALAIPFDDNDLGLAGMVMTERVYKGRITTARHTTKTQWSNSRHQTNYGTGNATCTEARKMEKGEATMG